LKKCTNCKNEKTVEMFSKSKKGRDGLRAICKMCVSLSMINYGRTKNGLIIKIFNNQKKSSKKRGHIPPEYSFFQLYEWVNSQDNFQYLWENWVKSDFKSGLIPSIDRLDNSKGYNFENISLTTWDENNQNARISQSKGELNSSCKIIPVLQYDKNNNFIKKFHSMSEAKRQTNINQISSCCSGKRKSAGGFVWKYA